MNEIIKHNGIDGHIFITMHLLIFHRIVSTVTNNKFAITSNDYLFNLHS